MSYFAPSPYKCIKCDHEFEYSSDHMHPAPVLNQEVQTEKHGIQTKSIPVCPKCWAEFLMKNIGLGYATSVWRAEGSDYEIEKAKK